MMRSPSEHLKFIIRWTRNKKPRQNFTSRAAEGTILISPASHSATTSPGGLASSSLPLLQPPFPYQPPVSRRLAPPFFYSQFYLPSRRSLASPGSAPVERTKSDRTMSIAEVVRSWIPPGSWGRRRPDQHLGINLGTRPTTRTARITEYKIISPARQPPSRLGTIRWQVPRCPLRRGENKPPPLKLIVLWDCCLTN